MKFNMNIIYGAFALAALGLWAGPALADTTEPPNLTIAEEGKKTLEIPIFDKWTKGATLAVGDLGTDGVPELVTEIQRVQRKIPRRNDDCPGRHRPRRQERDRRGRRFKRRSAREDIR
jgi:hypothetical protein